LVEIISEACAKLSDEFKAQYPNIPWKEIINMRIIIANIFHRIDSDLVWDTAKDSVPLLVLALKSN